MGYHSILQDPPQEDLCRQLAPAGHWKVSSKPLNYGLLPQVLPWGKIFVILQQLPVPALPGMQPGFVAAYGPNDCFNPLGKELHHNISRPIFKTLHTQPHWPLPGEAITPTLTVAQ